MPQAASARLALIATSTTDALNIYPAQLQAIVARLEAVAALYQIGLAAARPAASATTVGTFYIATDTGAVSVATSSSWVQVNATTNLTLTQNNAAALTLSGAAGGITFGADANLYRAGAGILKTDGAFTAGSLIVSPTASAARLGVDAAGTLFFAGPTGAYDTVLYRAGVDLLKTDDNFVVGNTRTVGVHNTAGTLAGFSIDGSNQMSLGSTDGSGFGALSVRAGTLIDFQVSTGGRLRLDSAGTLIFGAGLDTNLYRGAANTLQTDDAFKVLGDNVWIANDAGGGLYFGNSPDTRLYRAGNNSLRTPGALTVDSTLQGLASIVAGPGAGQGAVHLVGGTVNNAGYLAWFGANGTRQAYFGFNLNNTGVNLQVEQGTFTVTGQRVSLSSRWESHTWAVGGEIKVASGDLDYIPTMFTYVNAAEVLRVHYIRYRINGGTSVTFDLRRRTAAGAESNIATGLSASPSATGSAVNVTVADGDQVYPVVTAVSGAPKNLSVSVGFDRTAGA